MQKSSLKHLIFYDGECGLCDRAVQIALKLDKRCLFAFAPLQGTTAAYYLEHFPKELKQVDSVILVENYQSDHFKVCVMSKAVFRLFWLLGGGWAFIGCLSFLPSFLFDWGYRLAARNRHRLFPETQCFVPPRDQKERFFP